MTDQRAPRLDQPITVGMFCAAIEVAGQPDFDTHEEEIEAIQYALSNNDQDADDRKLIATVRLLATYMRNSARRQ